ncbi:Ig-like domain-containing protein [Lentilactobacillus senioris]|uniref:Ig-like domain-containing protein n=1 Tax=Lentilactobacillus senioris TaxID=931534 RepID=UPI00227ED2BE|nr:Ig-like domain-containing protein [Lentilactobacillus senioris]MCY9806352.1 Ig-like domain-containing protein [Lentilactobacillus senioris]
MKKFKLASFIAALAVALFVGTTAASAKTASPSLSVNPVVNNSKTVTGKATKGVGIVVRTGRGSAGKTLAKSTASKTTGKYTVKLKSAVKTNQKLYVYARRSSTSYFYRIVTVQAKAANTSNTSKTDSSSASSNKTSNVNIATPTGTWKSNSHNGYNLVYSFSQSKGFNSYLYKNGKKVKNVVRYASYNVKANSPQFWQISYKAKGSKTTKKFYIHFSSNKRFYLVNSNEKVTKQSIAGRPAATYYFNLK